MYAERWTHAEGTLYAEMEVPPGWPMVVRERAVESAKRRADEDAEPPTDPEDETFLLGERCARAYMQADAVGLIAERASGAGFEVRGGEDAEHPEEDSIPVSGTRAERYQVMLHVNAGTLEGDGDAGQSELEDGTRVSPALRSAVSRVAKQARRARSPVWPLGSAVTSRRIACDAGLVKIAHGADGQIVGAGRRSRTIPPSLRRALEARDRGCRFPGCGLRFTDAHHVKHWADGGETSLRNVLLLCRRHHRAVHEGGVRVCIDINQQVVFFTPRGRALFDVPPVRGRSMAGISPQPGADLARLRPSHREGASRWKRDGEIPWAVEARAWEAFDSG